MKIVSVQSCNPNISFKNRRAYYLYDLVKKYDKLRSSEKIFLERNNFNKQKLQALDNSLNEINSSTKLDYIAGHEVLLRNAHRHLFEIGEQCKLFVEDLFFRGIRLPKRNLEFAGESISADIVKKEFNKIIEQYFKLKKGMTGGLEEDFYKSKTMDLLYSPEYKIKPQKTENGFVTTVINKKTKSPEKAYIEIVHKKNTNMLLIRISKDIDDAHPIEVWVGENDNEKPKRILGILKSDYYEKGSFTDAYCYSGDTYAEEEYGGIGYRLLQALIEYSLKLNANVIVSSLPEHLPLYYKAGFRVNPEKDILLDPKDFFITNIRKECKKYGISAEQIQDLLKKSSRADMSGIGKNEILANFNMLLYQKNKHIYYPPEDICLELSPETMAEWLERIKMQPIIPENI